MNLRRVGILLHKEFFQSSRNVIFIFAVVVPLAISLVVSLLFGTLFAGKPRLGIADAGQSQFTQAAQRMASLTVKEFEAEEDLREAAEMGAVDVGVALPADFDARIAAGQTTSLTAYIWGESLLKHRAMLVAAMAVWVRDIAGQESPVEISTTVLGNRETLPWEQRLLPLIVLMSVLFGGVMLPASSLVTEKQKGTLTALSVTPTRMSEIYTAKGLMGMLLSVLMGVLILALNRAFGGQPALLVGVLALGAVLAAEFGVLLGMQVKDINTLFATIKSIGIFLYAPAFIYMFPQLPQWIGKIFPTYYMVQPVIEIAQHGAGLAQIAWQLIVLGALIILVGVMLALLTRRRHMRAA